MPQSTSARLTICVPVFNGARWVAESLTSIRRQSFADFAVLVSDDASTDGSAEICREFVSNSRFRLVVQPHRLGWAENCNWLVANANSQFLFIQCHDDVLEPNCIEALVEHISARPACSVAFPDLKAIGTEDHLLSQASISGSAFDRAYDMMAHHYNAVAFHGVIRTAAAGEGLRLNSFDSFAADTTWLMRLACAGELHRVEHALIQKRFHPEMTHFQWTKWDEEKKIGAWCTHCCDILGEALRLDLPVRERSLLVFAALQRLLLTGADLGPYKFFRDLPRARKVEMVIEFLERMRDDLASHPIGEIIPAADGQHATASCLVDALEAPFERLKTIDALMAAKQAQIGDLTSALETANAERIVNREVIATMSRHLAEANADRAASREVIETLSADLKEANADRTACHQQLGALSRDREKGSADLAAGHAAPTARASRPWHRIKQMIRRTLRSARSPSR